MGKKGMFPKFFRILLDFLSFFPEFFFIFHRVSELSTPEGPGYATEGKSLKFLFSSNSWMVVSSYMYSIALNLLCQMILTLPQQSYSLVWKDM